MVRSEISLPSSPVVLPERQIKLVWNDGAKSCFHFVWLRQQYFHPAIGRPDQCPGDTFRLPDEPESVRVRTCRIDDDMLVIVWDNDDAETRHELGWLRNNAYDHDLRTARKLKCVPWVGAQAEQFMWHSWDAVLADDGALWELYADVRDRGFARVAGAPVKEGEVAKLGERFGPLRASDYGTVSNIMTTPKVNPERYVGTGSGATMRIAPHTDEPWRYGPPGLLFHFGFQCTPSGGGASILVDGLLAAERLRENDPTSFEFLATVPLRFAGLRNPQERFIATARLIATDQEGDIMGVRYNDRTFGLQDLPEHLIEPAYRALRAFAKELYAEDLPYEHLLLPGEVHIFDNHRILHARQSFDEQAGIRRLQTCSVDREEFHNRLRRLAESLGHEEDAEMILPNGALG